MTKLRIETARVFKPLLSPSRYKGAHGGRGSGKSHFFAELGIEHCILNPGTRWLCGREVQKSLKESAKLLIEDKIRKLNLQSHFDVQERQIRTPGDGLIVFQGLAEHTIDTMKSFEGFRLFWGEEAHAFSERSVAIIRPTFRADNSELWFSWNPRRKSDPVDALLRGPYSNELGAVVIRSNWSDNPWFPEVLKREREFDEIHSPETYEHVWEGAYATVVKGAYYAASLSNARREGRIGALCRDDILEIRAFWDLGVEDSMSIWIAQFAGKTIQVLDYIEGQGQPLSYYVQELRKRGYENALCVLPHDGARRDSVTAVKFEDHLKDAGFRVKTVLNQGKGAAILRVEAGRRLFPRIWFNEKTCLPGLEALGAYHEKRDEDRNVGLGPEHDWSSHAADAFGLMCIAYEGPKPIRAVPARPQYQIATDSGTGMGGNDAGYLGS